MRDVRIRNRSTCSRRNSAFRVGVAFDCTVEQYLTILCYFAELSDPKIRAALNWTGVKDLVPLPVNDLDPRLSISGAEEKKVSRGCNKERKRERKSYFKVCSPCAAVGTNIWLGPIPDRRHVAYRTSPVPKALRPTRVRTHPKSTDVFDQFGSSEGGKRFRLSVFMFGINLARSLQIESQLTFFALFL